MKIKTYEPDLGESISECISNALRMSTRLASLSKPSWVRFKFNGTKMLVDARVGDASYYLNRWNVRCKERMDTDKEKGEVRENSSHKEDVLNYKVDLERTLGLDHVTKNGEICYDNETKEFVVFEETYAYEVGRSHYPLCALDMFQTYCKEYL